MKRQPNPHSVPLGCQRTAHCEDGAALCKPTSAPHHESHYNPQHEKRASDAHANRRRQTSFQGDSQAVFDRVVGDAAATRTWQ